ncbi:DUF1761 domain-containing protein [candidate division KSB1 bacterium]|nr:DUF1761 domain-containing protein [candidate division KSB1 bacterium]
MFTALNFWAILVSGALFWVLGGIWYAAVFSKPWQEALGFNQLDATGKARLQKEFPKALLAHFVCGLIISFVMAKVVSAMGATSVLDGMASGFWMWLAFAFTLQLISMMFEKRPTQVFLVNNGFYLLAFALIGGIVAVWR